MSKNGYIQLIQILGRPTPEVVLDLQKTLDRQLEEGRVPGDGLDNFNGLKEGLINVGGRTRVLQFAPGSTTKVFAGAVSGGLWVNNDITMQLLLTQVSGVPSNMAVTCMAIDQNLILCILNCSIYLGCC